MYVRCVMSNQKVPTFGVLLVVSRTLATLILVCAFSLVWRLGLAQQTAALGPTNELAMIQPDAALSPDEALQNLTAGNERFVQNAPMRPDQSPSRRTQLDFSQHPFACILTCSDSRVPPELIFDQGLGNLYVVRIAGNILNEDGLGSLEYAVERLQSPLIVVLGHSRCETVSAAVNGHSASGHAGDIMDALKPAVRATKDKHGDAVGAGH